MQLLALGVKHLPHIHQDDHTEDSLAMALFLERQYWKNMGDAVTHGIAQAFSE